MGMFDYVNVKDSIILPWPEGWNTDVVLPLSFQTKDLYCCLESYEINKSGLLILIKEKKEWREDKKASLFGGYLETISSEEVFQSTFSDYLFFYASVQDYSLTEDAWIEYKALFEKGLLKSIEVKEFRLQGSTVRKDGLERLRQSFAQEEILSKKSYYPLVRAARWVRRKNRGFWFAFFTAISRFFSSIAFFIIRRF